MPTSEIPTNDDLGRKERNRGVSRREIFFIRLLPVILFVGFTVKIKAFATLDKTETIQQQGYNFIFFKKIY